MSALVPRLTPLDRRVLNAVPVDAGARRPQILAAATRGTTALRFGEAGEILDALEHLGLVEKRNGWWRRCT